MPRSDCIYQLTRGGLENQPVATSHYGMRQFNYFLRTDSLRELRGDPGLRLSGPIIMEVALQPTHYLATLHFLLILCLILKLEIWISS